jgi:hypothetical protein
MFHTDIDTEQLASRQREMAYSPHYANAYYWGGDGCHGGAMYSNLMMPDYGGSGRTNASADQWEPRMTQCKSARHARNDSQLRTCRAARNGLGVYVLESLTQHDCCWLHGLSLDYRYPMNRYGYGQPIASAAMGTAAEAQLVADTKTVCQFDALRHALFENPHGREILPATSNGPTTALDNR